MKAIINRLKSIILFVLPLSLRKVLIVFLNQQSWIDPKTRYWWTVEGLKDYAKNDTDNYHKFLWNNHLAYAETYEIERRFGKTNLEPSRRLFFTDLILQLEKIGINPEKDIHSVFEVGCSLGYQLRYMEKEVFPSAKKLVGVDIDRYAVEKGQEYLKEKKSRVRISYGDMEKLETILTHQKYDILIATGVLLYLEECAAQQVVKKMLESSNVLIALSGLANPDADNKKLSNSTERQSDKTYIHNFDRMISDSGGKVLYRRWEGEKMYKGHTIYFVFGKHIK